MLGCAELLALSVLSGHERATALVRPALALLIVLNAIFLLLLVVELRPALARVFASHQLWYVGLLALGGGMLVPLGLLLSGSAALMLSAALLLVLGSLAIRFVIIKIPHALTGNAPSASS